MTNTRIDKWLWAVRIYKSRSLATEACNGGKVKIEDKRVKPSRILRAGEIITVQTGYVKKTYKVLGLLDKRVSAKIVVKYAEDITPKDELLKLETLRTKPYLTRYKGMGRPTKKERRQIEKFIKL